MTPRNTFDVACTAESLRNPVQSRSRQMSGAVSRRPAGRRSRPAPRTSRPTCAAAADFSRRVLLTGCPRLRSWAVCGPARPGRSRDKTSGQERCGKQARSRSGAGRDVGDHAWSSSSQISTVYSIDRFSSAMRSQRTIRARWSSGELARSWSRALYAMSGSRRRHVGPSERPEHSFALFRAPSDRRRADIASLSQARPARIFLRSHCGRGRKPVRAMIP